MWAAAIGPPSDDTKTYALFYAFLLSICCRDTAAFFFCASSNSRFNSLTIAISLAGSVSATASRQRSRQSLRASWVIDASQKRKNYSNIVAEMLSALPVQNLSCCANSPASPPLTISIAKRKRSLWPSSPPPLLCATSSGTQSRRASTYLQGNSRVDKPFRMEDKTRAIISGAGERGNPRDTSPPPWRRRFCSFGFPDSRSAPHYASSEQHGGQP